MKKKSVLKSLVTFLLAIIIITGIGISANATYYPTATLVYKTASTIKRGRSVTFRFYLNCGSYYRTSRVWRSQVEFNIYNPNYRLIGRKTVNFSGNGYYTYTIGTIRSIRPGTYTLNYRTYFNAGTCYYRWMYNTRYSTNRNVCFYVRK